MTERPDREPIVFFIECLIEYDWVDSVQESQHNKIYSEPHRMFIETKMDGRKNEIPDTIHHENKNYGLKITNIEGNSSAGYLVVEFETVQLEPSG